jgi:hypothetical protein
MAAARFVTVDSLPDDRVRTKVVSMVAIFVLVPSIENGCRSRGCLSSPDQQSVYPLLIAGTVSDEIGSHE